MEGDNFSEQPKLTHVQNATISFPVFISVIGTISVALAVMLYHFLLLRYCRHHHHHSDRRVPAQSTTSHPQSSMDETQGVSVGPISWFGLDDRALEFIPVVPYCERALDFYRIDQSECVVCLGKLERGERVRWLPGCAHAFHVTCIDNWLHARATCPTCRTPVVVPPPLLRCANSGLTRARSGGALRRDGGDKASMAEADSSSVGLSRSLSVDRSCIVIEGEGGHRDFSTSSSLSNTSRMAATSLMRSIFGFMAQDGDHKILPY